MLQNLHATECSHRKRPLAAFGQMAYTKLLSRNRNCHHPRKFPHALPRSVPTTYLPTPQATVSLIFSPHGSSVVSVLKFHRDGNIRYILLCICLLLLSIMFLALPTSVFGSASCWAEGIPGKRLRHIRSTHSIAGHVRLFPVSGYRPFFLWPKAFISLGKYLEADIPGSEVGIYVAEKQVPELSPKQRCHFTLLWTTSERYSCPITLPAFSVSPSRFGHSSA